MISAFSNTFKVPELRNRVLFTIIMLVIIRIGAAIPCPGINVSVLQEWLRTAASSDSGGVAALFNLFSGGAIENCAIFSLGVMPYISAQIMFQMFVALVPSLSKLSREDNGRQKIAQYTRYATIALCVLQGALLARTFEHPENNCEAIAGIWNEYQKRQYCLFINLAIHQSSQQVCGHISGTGGATPGHRYCMDAAIGNTPISLNQWQCIAMTYDGEYIKSYLNGKLDVRENLNPYHYPLGIFDGGNDGGSFTVGAVARPLNVQKENKESPDVGNLFHGLLGGLAVFNRTLLEAEKEILAESTIR